MKKLKEKIGITHTRADIDVFFTAALLKIKKFFFLKSGEGSTMNFRNARYIDRGRQDLDHHGKKGKTSFDLVLEELNLQNEKWAQPIKRFVQRADLNGESLPYDVSQISKAVVRIKDINDEENMQIGIEMAEAILKFHKKELLRDNEFTRQIIAKFIDEKKEKVPKMLTRYFEQLSNPKFERPSDLVEILTGYYNNNPKNLEKTKRFAEKLLEYTLHDRKLFEKAQEDLQETMKIKTRKGLIIVKEYQEEANPKFNVAARKIGAIAVIQRQMKNKQTQIFFDTKRITRKQTDKIISFLRLLEAGVKINKNELTKEGRIEKVNEWFYFVGEKGGVMILNGSLTAPNVPPSQLSTQQIIESVKAGLETQ